jgi:hypothetical protein
MTLLAGAVPEAREQAEALRAGTADLLAPDNVLHQNSLQVHYASRFVIASEDKFDLAKEMIAKNPKLKEPPGFTVW